MWANYLAGQDQSNQILDQQAKRAELAQLMQSRQQDSQFKAQLQPYELEKAGLSNQGLGLENQTTQAKLPGVQADSDLKRVTATNAQRTQESDIATRLSSNDNAQQEDRQKALDRARKFLLESAPALAGEAAPLRAQRFQEMARDAKINLDSPLTKKFLDQVQRDPQGFPQFVNNYANQLGALAESMDTHARSAKEVARIGAAATEKSAGIHAGATVQAAKIGAASREEVQRLKIDEKLDYADDVMRNLKTGKTPPDRAALAAKVNLMEASTKAERAKWLEIGAFADQMMRAKSAYGHEGDPQLAPGANGGMQLNPRSVPPLFPEAGGGQPKMSDDDLIKKHLGG